MWLRVPEASTLSCRVASNFFQTPNRRHFWTDDIVSKMTSRLWIAFLLLSTGWSVLVRAWTKEDHEVGGPKSQCIQSFGRLRTDACA